MTSRTFSIAHPMRRLTGRDPHEPHRVANTLELLYDLTYVVAFSIAGNQFAHLASAGEWNLGLIGYAFALFAIIWAWTNATWFASAFDTDDWLYRVTTMVQMVGVVIFALGSDPFFDSLQESHGKDLDLTGIVAGYVVMRLALGVQWLRVIFDSPRASKTARGYLLALTVAQLGWVLLGIFHPDLNLFLGAVLILLVVEMGGPVLAERAGATQEYPTGTPWHPHHLSERYGLMFIITLGEGVVGTVAALYGVVDTAGGWSLEAVLVTIAGITLAFALWWAYFGVNWGDALAAHPERGISWGYGHILLLGGTAAIGAGMHIVGYVIEGQSKISPTQAVLSVAIPLLIVMTTMIVLFNLIYRVVDLFHGLLVAANLVILGLAVVTVQAGAGMGWALLVASLAPVVTVVAYETVGHRQQAGLLAQAKAS